MDVTKTLCQFAAGLRYEDLPESVVDHVKRCLLDCLGVALCGSMEPAAEKARALATPCAGAALVWGTSLRASTIEAALMNGTAAHALDFDDNHAGAVPLHLSAVAAPALLAVGERCEVDGRDLIVAFAAGAEVAARIGEAVGETHLLRGWHGTGTVATFAAAIGAGKLLGLSARKMEQCVGIAAVQAAGLLHASGTMCKPLHAGKAAANGVTAALLTEVDFSAPDEVLDAPRGFGPVFSEAYNPAAALEEIGQRWVMFGMGIKPHACCVQAHATLDAVMQVRREHRLRLEQIELVRLEVPPLAATAAGIRSPKNSNEAKFSLPFCVSIGLVSDEALPAQFSDAMTQDPNLQALWPKVEIVSEGSLDQGQARVTFETIDGCHYEGFVKRARGYSDNPLSQADVERKFTALARPVVGARQSARLVKQVAGLEDARVADIISCLARSEVVDDGRQPVGPTASSRSD